MLRCYVDTIQTQNQQKMYDVKIKYNMLRLFWWRHNLTLWRYYKPSLFYCWVHYVTLRKMLIRKIWHKCFIVSKYCNIYYKIVQSTFENMITSHWARHGNNIYLQPDLLWSTHIFTTGTNPLFIQIFSQCDNFNCISYGVAQKRFYCITNSLCTKSSANTSL